MSAEIRTLPMPGKLTSISAPLLRGPGMLVHVSTIALVALVGGFVWWSNSAVLDEVTVGQGRVIPSGRVQVVQNLEGGIVRRIGAELGASVEAGDVLLQIDPLAADASLGERREKSLGLRALMTRLEAETEGKEPVFNDDLILQAPELVQQQRDLFTNRRQEINAALSGLDQAANQRRNEIIEMGVKIESHQKGLELAREERALTAPLVERGSAARLELIRIDTRINEIQGALDAARAAIPRARQALEEAQSKRTEKEKAWRSDALTQLNDMRVQLASLQQTMRADTDKRDRTEVRAPVAGLIKSVSVNTQGQVIKPGMDLFEIVPRDDSLLVEAKIRPQDVAFLRPGQAATVKITAYDFSIYGGLAGKVERIGADSTTDQKGETYYLIQVRTDRAALEHKGRSLPIIPGMVADTDILTGRKSVLQYLMKPITRMQMQAMRER
ncbi:MAG: HlyD family type I secretion periplasmic adaptor subunit [Bosea sp. (in: a-proteobacteria)]